MSAFKWGSIPPFPQHTSIKTSNKMNREILFRAWDSKFGVMIPQVCPYDNNNLLIVDVLINGCYPEDKLDERIDSLEYGGEEHYCMMKDFVLMQYTGLKDKNGTPIYEGDLVKVHNGKDNIRKIFFYHGSFTIGKYMESSSPVDWDEQNGDVAVDEFSSEITVVGNIYEHPHLTEK